jgi:2-oxoglutarate dehydrogenase E2 component (dihydrolipoamide succinyltransferase)
MAIEIRIPEVGESITEVEIGGWLKGEGERLKKDEPVVSIESEKATVELPAPESGTLSRLLKQKGEVAKVGEVIGYLEKEGPAQGATVAKPAKAAEKGEATSPRAEAAAKAEPPRVMPAAQRVLDEHNLSAAEVKASGPGGRLLKEDVERHVAQAQPPASGHAAAPPAPQHDDGKAVAPHRQQEIVPMSRLRRTVAERLVQAQHSAALLTTFNEIDMGEVMRLRKEYAEAFLAKYQVKLGFMSFFVKAVIDALKQFPNLNAEIQGTNIVFHNFFDIGVAVGSGKGLVVPVLRNAERMSFAQIEIAIGDFARRAKENKLKVEELQGGTFTISNGGVYGSLLSTPIVNPPQSGVLGMHAIQERPVAREGNVVIRPMMYVALTYDHRIVDGREAVSFLKRLKEAVEMPARMLLEI